MGPFNDKKGPKIVEIRGVKNKKITNIELNKPTNVPNLLSCVDKVDIYMV